MKFVQKLMVAIFFLLLHGAIVSQKAVVRNLIIITDEDPKEIENPTVYDFLAALCQRAAPIIVHKNVFPVLANTRDAHYTLAKEIVQNAYQTCDIYQHVASDLFLLIPHAYKKELMQEFPREVEDKVLGFAISDEKNFIKMIAADVEKIVYDKKAKSPTAAEINSFFMKPDTILKGLWNIYAIGHGLLPRKEKEFAEPLELFAHKKNENINLDSNPIIAGLAVDEFRRLISNLQENNTNFLFYKSCYSGGYNIFALFVNNLFVDKALSEQEAEAIWPTLAPEKRAATIPQIKSSVTIKSSGEVIQFNPNFTIAAGSSFDLPIRMNMKLSFMCPKEGLSVAENYRDFGAFFELLRVYTQNELKIAGHLKPILFSDTELRNILSKVTEKSPSAKDPLSIAATPQVRFPDIEKFIPFPLDKNIFVLSYSKIKAKELEHAALDITEKSGVNIIFLPVRQIPITIKITAQKMPALVSTLPGIGAHVIESIDAQGIGFTELVHSFAYIATDVQKYFFISNIRVHSISKEDQGHIATLSDVLICVYGSSIRMFFVMRDNIYFTAASTYGDKEDEIYIKTMELEHGQGSTHGNPLYYLRLFKTKGNDIISEYNKWNAKLIPFSGTGGARYVGWDNVFWDPLNR